MRLAPSTIRRRIPGPQDIQIDILYCGVCHSDLHQARNEWQQNGYDSFLVELAKYGLGGKDLAFNINFFSKVTADGEGNLQLVEDHSTPGSYISLRFEMDTLAVFHTCPHPLNRKKAYPRTPVNFEFFKAEAVADDDYCRNFRPENRRGFENNRLYYLGWSA